MNEERSFFKVASEAISSSLTEIRLNTRFVYFYIILLNLAVIGAVEFLKKRYITGILMIFALPVSYILYNINMEGFLNWLAIGGAVLLLLSWFAIYLNGMIELYSNQVSFPPESAFGILFNNFEFDTKIAFVAASALYYEFIYLQLDKFGIISIVIEQLDKIVSII